MTATDNHLTDTEAVTITVANLNRYPTLNPIGDQWTVETRPLTFSVSASDPDGITPTLSASDVPPGASFITETGVFSWTPDYGAAGIYAITFGALDDELADLETIAVTVTSSCTSAQSVSISGPSSALSGTAASFYASYLPADAINVTLAWDNGTNRSSAAYMWREEGAYSIVVTATGACGDPISATHTVTVDVGCTPVSSVSIDGPISVTSGIANVYTASYLPTGATGVDLFWDNGATGPSAEYIWQTGIHTIVVTASADCGIPVTATHTVTAITSRQVYLPLIIRSFTEP